ncbi:MAG: hypothetical protein RSE00_01795 [Clostridia bacterium]
MNLMVCAVSVVACFSVILLFVSRSLYKKKLKEIEAEFLPQLNQKIK